MKGLIKTPTGNGGIHQEVSHKDYWAFSMDLKDAFFHVLVHAKSRKYLQILFQCEVFSLCIDQCADPSEATATEPRPPVVPVSGPLVGPVPQQRTGSAEGFMLVLNPQKS